MFKDSSWNSHWCTVGIQDPWGHCSNQTIDGKLPIGSVIENPIIQGSLFVAIFLLYGKLFLFLNCMSCFCPTSPNHFFLVRTPDKRCNQTPTHDYLNDFPDSNCGLDGGWGLQDLSSQERMPAPKYLPYHATLTACVLLVWFPFQGWAQLELP